MLQPFPRDRELSGPSRGVQKDKMGGPMLKKSFLASCFLIITAYIARPSFGATLNIGEVSGSQGSVTEIPVPIDDPSGMAGFQFTILFDKDVLQPAGAFPGTVSGNWLIQFNDSLPGCLSVTGLCTDLAEQSAETASLVKLLFIVTGDIDDTSQLEFTDYLFCDELANPIPVTPGSGIFTVTFPSGDINGDTSVNIQDVIFCLRIAIGLPVTVNDIPYEPEYPGWLIQRADINGEGGANISDVILILRKSIGLDQG